MTTTGPAPAVSVVVACRNSASTVAETLEALAAQDCELPWELIVVDNGSTDGTLEEVGRWRERLPLRTTRWATPGKGVAVNHGVSLARAPLLAFCDSDDRVAPGWLSAAVAGLADADMVTGPVDFALLNPPSTFAWRGIDRWGRLPDWHHFLPGALGCNLAVRRATFEALGGFRTDGRVPEEDFGLVWRGQLAGCTLGFAEQMVVHWRLRTSPRAYFAAQVRYGTCDVGLFADFHRRGMPRRSLRGALRLGWLVAASPLLLWPSQRYRWLASAGTACGHLVGSWRLRVLYL